MMTRLLAVTDSKGHGTCLARLEYHLLAAGAFDGALNWCRRVEKPDGCFIGRLEVSLKARLEVLLNEQSP
jgi:hypothetical protein